MSHDKNPSSSGAYNYSTDISPRDTRNPPTPVRPFEPIAQDNNEDSMITSGTVRRTRLPAISTSGDNNYGKYMLSSSRVILLTSVRSRLQRFS